MAPDAALPELTTRALTTFVEQARAAFADNLISVVLYGSAAEGRLRKTSDVNVLLLLERFDPAAADPLREPLRTAHAAIRLQPMFVLRSELDAVARAFPDKLGDIARRHRVLYGQDPFVQLQLTRTERVARLRQVLLNAVLRLRETYVRVSLRDERAALAVAEHAAPLRVAAVELLVLSGHAASSPKNALAEVVAGESRFVALTDAISAAREGRLPAGQGAASLAALIELAELLRARVLALPAETT